jgi:hypothetical protein
MVTGFALRDLGAALRTDHRLLSFCIAFASLNFAFKRITIGEQFATASYWSIGSFYGIAIRIGDITIILLPSFRIT